MSKNDYLFYRNYIKYRKISKEKILITRTKDSYLIGPIINNKFDEESFYRRLTSNSIYSQRYYKKMFKLTINNLIKKYIDYLNSNEVLEVFRNGKIKIHKIIKVPK